MNRLPEGFKLGNCVIQEYLGAGLSGDVYKARYREKTTVALKLFSKDREQDRTVLGYFLNEQMLIREVTEDRRHPHIVEYVTSHEAPPHMYLATRYIEGAQALEKLIHQPLSKSFVLHVIEKLASALDYLHYGHPTYSPIIHRDVKPHNVLIGPRNEVILIDMSISRFPTFGLEEERGLGTVQYMPPEQYDSKETPATDQFALAVMALQMLANYELLSNDKNEARAQLAELRDSDYVEVRDLFAEYPQTAEVLIKALQYEAKQRYASCEEFAHQLRQALITDGVAIDPIHPRMRPLRAYIEYAIIALVAIVAITLLALSLGWLSFGSG